VDLDQVRRDRSAEIDGVDSTKILGIDDHVAPVAGIEVDRIATVADDHIVASSALQRLAVLSREDLGVCCIEHVVAGCPLQQAGVDIVARQDRPIGKLERRNAWKTEFAENGQRIVRALELDDKVLAELRPLNVANTHIGLERHRAAVVIDRVVAVAVAEHIGIIARSAGEILVARAAIDHRSEVGAANDRTFGNLLRVQQLLAQLIERNDGPVRELEILDAVERDLENVFREFALDHHGRAVRQRDQQVLAALKLGECHVLRPHRAAELDRIVVRCEDVGQRVLDDVELVAEVEVVGIAAVASGEVMDARATVQHVIVVEAIDDGLAIELPIELLDDIFPGQISAIAEGEHLDPIRLRIFLVESVTAIQTLKAMAIEPQMQRRWEEQLAGYVGASFDVLSLGNWVVPALGDRRQRQLQEAGPVQRDGARLQLQRLGTAEHFRHANCRTRELMRDLGGIDGNLVEAQQ
jgi:hypothetical protein